MRDRDDVPYIVIERETGGGVGSFLAGALLGAGLALLFAPKTGKETQEELRARAKQLKEVAEERVRDASRQLEERLVQLENRLPNSNISHRNFWPRAFAVWGHILAINAIVWLGILFIILAAQSQNIR